MDTSVAVMTQVAFHPKTLDCQFIYKSYFLMRFKILYLLVSVVRISTSFSQQHYEVFFGLNFSQHMWAHFTVKRETFKVLRQGSLKSNHCCYSL